MTKVKTTDRGLKEEGCIRYTNVTHYTLSAYDTVDRVMTASRPDFIQINYSIISREAEKQQLSLATDCGIGVIANRPFEQSGLFYELHRQDLVCMEFIPYPPAETYVIPSTGNRVHLTDNMQAASGTLPDQRTREKMARYVESAGGESS